MNANIAKFHSQGLQTNTLLLFQEWGPLNWYPEVAGSENMTTFHPLPISLFWCWEPAFPKEWKDKSGSILWASAFVLFSLKWM